MSLVAPGRRLSELVSRRDAGRLRAFRRDVETALSNEVRRVILFGSRARGDARRDSDYDVAVFVEGLNDRRRIDHLLADIAYPYILAGTHIRPVSVPSDYLERRPHHSFAINLARDGVVIS